jgi:hypothetical protein
MPTPTESGLKLWYPVRPVKPKEEVSSSARTESWAESGWNNPPNISPPTLL